eukprot:scaffold2351_cov403-Prasinococcus_capsulatus_cf.AAC.18
MAVCCARGLVAGASASVPRASSVRGRGRGRGQGRSRGRGRGRGRSRGRGKGGPSGTNRGSGTVFVKPELMELVRDLRLQHPGWQFKEVLDEELKARHQDWTDTAGLKTKVARILRAVKRNALSQSIAETAKDVSNIFLTYYGKYGIVRCIHADELSKLRGLLRAILDSDDEGPLWVDTSLQSGDDDGSNKELIFPEVEQFEEAFVLGEGELLVAVDQSKQRFIGCVAICPAPENLREADRLMGAHDGPSAEEGKEGPFALWEVRRLCIDVSATWEPAALKSFLLRCAMSQARLKGAKRLVARAWERTFNYTLPTDSFYKAHGFLASELDSATTESFPDVSQMDIDLTEASIEEILAFRKKVEQEQRKMSRAISESALYEVELDDLEDEILRLPLPDKLRSAESDGAGVADLQDMDTIEREQDNTMHMDDTILAAFNEALGDDDGTDLAEDDTIYAVQESADSGESMPERGHADRDRIMAVLDDSKAVTVSPAKQDDFMSNGTAQIEEEEEPVGELVEVVALSSGQRCITVGVTPFLRTEAEACRLLVKGVGVLLLKFVQGEPMIFVQKRSSTKRTYGGRLDMFVGGFKRWGEPTEEGAARELHEELGVANHDLEFMYEHVLVTDTVRSVVSCYACICDESTTVSFDDGEVESGSWMTFSNVADEISQNPERWVPGGRECFETLLSSPLVLERLDIRDGRYI